MGLMNKLSWEKASIFTPFEEMTKEFLELSSDEGICLDKTHTLDFEKQELMEPLFEETSDAIAILENMDSVLEIPSNCNAEWIVLPMEGIENISRQILRAPESPDIYIIEKAFMESPELMKALQLDVQVPFTSSIVEALVPLFEPKCKTDSYRKDEDYSLTLGIRSQKPKFYLYQLNEDHLKIIGEFRKERVFLYPNATDLFAPKAPRYGMPPQCLNLDPISATTALNWRFETWLTSILTIACMGIVSCLGIGVFIACKSCSIMIEGSQYLSLFLLLCLIFTYGALFLFGLSPNESVCQSRNFAVGSVYSLTFATLLGRSFMLATGDFEGLPGHISGIVQAVLIFFIFSVQLGMILQELFLRSSPYTETNFLGRLRMTECLEKGFPFIRYLIYPAILLFLQIVLAPFIINSKRNYKEGFLFVLASVAIAISWILWITGYLLFPNSLGSHWYDITVCFGLVSLPTIILVLIYIPKLYFMSCPPYKAPPMETLGVNLRRVNNNMNTFTTTSPGGEEQEQSSNSSSSSSRQLHPSSSMNIRESTIISHSQTEPCMNEYSNERISGEDSVDHCNPTTSFIGRNNRGSKLNLNYTAAANAAAVKAAQKYGESSQNEYPTFKLDKNSVIDPRWQRYSFSNGESSSNESKIPAPPPIPPVRNTNSG
ncbi:uncharacterized protein [Lepeophtheirus salmonis]